MFIIMFIVKGDEVDCIIGFEMGVDDYLFKLFNLCELLVCVKVVLCRCSSEVLGVLFKDV